MRSCKQTSKTCADRTSPWVSLSFFLLAFLGTSLIVVYLCRLLLVGVSNEHHMHPAPYKTSNPVGAEKVKSIDGAALRKESWILGQCPGTYASVNNLSYRSPTMD